jgi:hypothetical protein
MEQTGQLRKNLTQPGILAALGAALLFGSGGTLATCGCERNGSQLRTIAAEPASISFHLAFQDVIESITRLHGNWAARSGAVWF